jgi:hypothetical protein
LFEVLNYFFNIIRPFKNQLMDKHCMNNERRGKLNEWGHGTNWVMAMGGWT